MSRPARILLLCDDRTGNANTILDHINAFLRFSRHQVRTFNPRAVRNSWALDFDDFDVLVIHYSIVLSHDNFLSPSLREKLRRFGRLKVQFRQDAFTVLASVGRSNTAFLERALAPMMSSASKGAVLSP